MNGEEAVGSGIICQVVGVQYGGILNSVDEKGWQEATYGQAEGLCLH